LATLEEESALVPETITVKNDVKMIEVPVSENVEVAGREDECKSGFTPSLFTATSDHYIADMVLQVCLNIIERINDFIT
jgi:hypothetical protein